MKTPSENTDEVQDSYEDSYAHLDDEYDYVMVPVRRGKPINNRMATLSRAEGVRNRFRNEGLL